jgi:diadenylate cyclase
MRTRFGIHMFTNLYTGIVTWFRTNRVYKFVALLVALALWTTIIGRSDLVVSRDFTVQYLLKGNHFLVDDAIRRIRVKVSGPRDALKKFSAMEEAITLDLKGLSEGTQSIFITPDQLNLPFGVRVISLTPNMIRASIKAMPVIEK